MAFEKAHTEWIGSHLGRRKGERRGRLKRGHAHAEKLFSEKVWYVLKGNFDDLHPEYEVLDWRGRPYFADFAYLLGHYLRLIIEIKGYNSHVRDKDRKGHCDECIRETFLQGVGYRVVSFSYDDVNERPELCITLLRFLLSQFEPQNKPTERQVLGEQEIIRLAITLVREVRPIDVERHLRVNNRTATRMLQNLCVKGRMRPIVRENGVRVLQYELVKGRLLD
ncbi:hypothetical protein E5161_12345 [Cohnella pontilimi]|uniref:DUF559 domain-containing protein n=2 Tax=Cohnella pontilimi TaxID=2564100 RepID=A0A4U0FFA6_9BACL|nr:hypothetical protein [Cohnella pontilimi]TJY42042.1 hypothetical protein E5161_12345 [Cohnella pontilimi]